MINNVMITNVIHVLPSYPRFTLSSAFYCHIRVYPLVRPDIRPSIRPDIRLDIRPYPRFTLTLTRPPFVNLLYVIKKLINMQQSLCPIRCSGFVTRKAFYTT